jgi:hypothetical protein
MPKHAGGADAGADPADGGVVTVGCFVAGTPVVLADGSLKPIEQVSVGDCVLSRDEKKRSHSNRNL